MGAEAEARSGVHGAVASMNEMFDIAAGYLAPIAGVGVGLVFAQWFGGPWTLGNAIYQLTPPGDWTTGSAALLHAICGLIFTGIFAGGAFALWRAGGKMATLGKAVARFFSGFFGGAAIAYFAIGVVGYQNPMVAGAFDKAVLQVGGAL